MDQAGRQQMCVGYGGDAGHFSQYSEVGFGLVVIFVFVQLSIKNHAFTKAKSYIFGVTLTL